MIRLEQPRRRTGESVVPMINVAFLLLIFFLMVAVIAPPEPVPITLPAGETGQDFGAEADLVLSIMTDGTVLSGDGPFADMSQARGRSVIIRADASADATWVTEVLVDLSAAGAGSVQLAVSPR